MNETPETNEIIASALQLPLDGRITLLNAMLDSVEKSSENLSPAELEEAWSEAIKTRVKDIESGNVETVPSAELWERIGGKPNG